MLLAVLFAGLVLQVLADDPQLAPHDLGVEGLAGAAACVEEAGVVGDALASHAPRPWSLLVRQLRYEALHPRVATVAMVLLRNEYVTRGIASVPDGVIVEIVDEVYLPLVRGRGVSRR